MSESNMNVVRWCLVQGDPAKMQYDENGEWVSHQVYKGLEERWEELKDRVAELKADNGALSRNCEQAIKWVEERDERIAEVRESRAQLQHDSGMTERDLRATIAQQAAEIERLKAREKLILTPDLTILADANLQAKSTLENDKYASMVKNAHDILEEANDTALNWMSDPRDG